MSWQATTWADSLPYDLVGPLAYRVLIKLCNRADERGCTAWRSKSELARELGVSERSIQRAFKDLEVTRIILPGDQAFVQHLRGDRRPKVYDMNMRYVTEFEAPELPIEEDDPRGDKSVHHGETELSTGEPRGDKSVHHGETTVVAHRNILKTNTKERSQANQTARVSPSTIERDPLGWRPAHPCPARRGDTPCSIPDDSHVCLDCGQASTPWAQPHHDPSDADAVRQLHRTLVES